jgi:anti-anti-sigma regulatory factor
VRIQGDVDLPDPTPLGLAARQLVDAEARVIYVDLGGTTIMSSMLVAFLVHVANNGADNQVLTLRRPTPMGLRVIELTHLDRLFWVRADLPAEWPGEGDEPDAAHMWERYKSA